MNPEDCIVLVPVKGPIEPKTQDALGALVERGYPVQILRDGSQIDLARSWLATCALKRGYKETLWIDADMQFDPDDVEKLRAHNLPFVAGLYVRKTGKHDFACKFLPGTQEIALGPQGGLEEIAWAGMGFTLIRSEVYEALETMLPVCGGSYEGKTVVPYFIPMIIQEGEGFVYLSEDYSFCQRAVQAGYKIMVDTSIKLGHIGSKTYTWDDIKQEDAMANDSRLFEKIGRLEMALEQSQADYQSVCQTLADVVSGTLPVKCVMVNLTDFQVTRSNTGERVGRPPMINGLPNCVTAPEEVKQEAA